LLLCRHLDRRRFTPVVCCLDDRGALAPAFEADGVEVVALDRKPGIRLATLRSLAALMRSRHPDIVDAQGWPASFWGRLAALVTGTRPLVVTEHGDVEPRPLRHTLADAFLGVFTARVVAKSGEIASLYRRRVRIPARKVEVVPNGVECDALACAFDPVRARSLLGVPADLPTVGIVGRLHAVKGHDLFLAAVALLRAQEPGLLAVVVGDGPERAALEARASALGVADCVRMVGERSDVPEIIGAIDVLMLTSRSEGCPMVALEAMAAGVPLVAPRIAPFAEISGDGAAAVLVPAGDAPAFAAACLALLRDRRRRAALAEAARRRVREHYDIRRYVARLEQLFQRAGQPRGPVPAGVEAGGSGR
jgi:glycosyltransferase involved in cell wall biosynthesis